jgi:MinD-like ATPase involved in chromosome partitioning or flagellar assembly
LLLSSSRPKESLVSFNAEAAVSVVRTLRSMSKPVVADLGSGLSPNTLKIQREMDHLVVVVDPLLVTLTMAKDILQELDADRKDPSKIHVVVVNRAASSNPPSWNEVEQMLGREIRAIVSLASELAFQAQQAHTPIVVHQPTAIASSQMIKLAEDIATRLRTTTAEPAS